MKQRADNDVKSGNASLKEQAGSMFVRKVIRENHDEAIRALCWNTVDSRMKGILATVGGTCMSVYDNESYGDFLDIRMHFDNVTSTAADNDDLTALCWINSSRFDSDTALAVAAGSDIQVISVKRKAVVAVIRGDTNVQALCSLAHGEESGLLALRSGGYIEKHIFGKGYEESHCVWAIPHDGARTLCMKDDGSVMASGGRSLFLWNLVDIGDSSPISREISLSEIAPFKKASDTIDCVKFVGEDVLVKTVKGWICNVTTKNSVKIPGYTPFDGSDHINMSFAVDPQGECVVVGSTDGSIHILDLKTLSKIQVLQHVRSRAVITACEVNASGTQILATSAAAMVWRWDFVSQDLIKEFEEAEEKREKISKEIEERIALADEAEETAKEEDEAEETAKEEDEPVEEKEELKMEVEDDT